MSALGIQGHLLEVTVVGCTNLMDTELISRQDPYVCLSYGNTKYRTRTCTDGGKNPIFQEKFSFTLIEGLREINVEVWNGNTLSRDDYIGNGKVFLQRVLSQGYDDGPIPLQTKTGLCAGEVRFIMHYEHNGKAYAPPPAAPYATPTHPPPTPYQAPPYPTPPQATPAYPPSMPSYPTPSPYPAYPSYPSSMYPPPPSPAVYPPPQSGYPPVVYPPASPYYPPPGPFPCFYPPPRY